MAQRAGDVGDDVRDSKPVEVGARVGMAAYGVVHLVVAVLAVRLAIGDRAGDVSTTGALAEISQQPFGSVLLWVVGLGLLLLVLWRLLTAILGKPGEGDDPEWGSRAAAAMKAAVYGALGFSALQIATSDDQSEKGSGSGSTMTGTVMGWPGGQWLIALAGLAVVGYGCYQIWVGVDDKHAEKISGEGRTGETGRAYMLLGKVGYIAKGLALVLLGGLIAYAGATHSTRKSNGGLDQALGLLLDQPFGPWLVGAIGLGLACYGLFCLVRAAHHTKS